MPAAGLKIKKKCRNCGDRFIVTFSKRDKKFCSRKCYLEDHRRDKVTLLCKICGKKFEVFYYLKDRRRHCSKKCALVSRRKIVGKEHPLWKGGRYKDNDGYWVISLNSLRLEDRKLVNKSIDKANGRIYEHRVVMARHLKRPLKKGEIVHHINGDRLDNRISNLELIDRTKHNKIHHIGLKKSRNKSEKKLEIYPFMVNSLNRLLQCKKSSAEEILGYTKEDLIEHFEDQFVSGMNWFNHGAGRAKWQIHHIKPVSAFLKEGCEDPKIINALENLQPLWWRVHKRKDFSQ